MPIISAINSKLYKKTCYWLLFINFAKLTVRMSMYELYKIGKFMVYKFTVYCLQQIVDTYKLQVYSILNSLQQITSHWPISELLHLCTVDGLFFNELHDKLTTYFPLTLPPIQYTSCSAVAGRWWLSSSPSPFWHYSSSSYIHSLQS